MTQNFFLMFLMIHCISLRLLPVDCTQIFRGHWRLFDWPLSVKQFWWIWIEWIQQGCLNQPVSNKPQYEYMQNDEKHYNDVIRSAMSSQITSLTIVYSTVYSGADQRKYQSSASLAFVGGIHRWPVNSPHKGPVTRTMFLCDDVIVCCIWLATVSHDLQQCQHRMTTWHGNTLPLLTGVESKGQSVILEQRLKNSWVICDLITFNTQVM